MTLVSAPQRLVSWMEARLAVRRRGGRPPRWVVGVVLAMLVVGALAAIRSLPDDLGDFRWWPVAVLVAVTPIGLLLNGYEYLVSARVGGVRVRYWPALRVAVYGTAANLLPLPGASIVRIEAMRRSGAGLGRATAATAAVGATWLGVSTLAAGVLLAPAGITAVPFLVAGVVGVAAGWLVVRRGVPTAEALSNFGRILAVETAFVALQAVQLGLALAAIGAPVDAATAFTLGVSTTVAAATGFLPGGLGLREAIAAALGPVVGLEPSTAFLAAVIDRVVSLSIVAAAAVVILGRREPGRSAEAVVDAAER